MCVSTLPGAGLCVCVYVRPSLLFSMDQTRPSPLQSSRGRRLYFCDGPGSECSSLVTPLSCVSRVSVTRFNSASCVCRSVMLWLSSSSFRRELAACLLYSSIMQATPTVKMMASPRSSAPSSAAASSFRGFMADPRKPIIRIFVRISIQW